MSASASASPGPSPARPPLLAKQSSRLKTHQVAHSIRAKAAASPSAGSSFAPSGPSSPAPQYAGNNKGKQKANMTAEGKVVYKGLLESPLLVRWPSLPNHLQSSILHTICALLPGVAAHHLARGRLSRAPRTEEPLVNSLPVRPEVLDHLTIGLAGVTRLLQRSPSAVAQATSRALPVVIAVALQDVDPPSLVAHLPVLVAGWNGRVRAEGGGEDQCVRLVGLARGAEAVLVGALGLRRACVVAIHASLAPSQLDLLLALLPPPLNVPHLQPPPTPSTSSLPSPFPPPTSLITHAQLLPTQRPVAATGKPLPSSSAHQPQAQQPQSDRLVSLRAKLVRTTAPKDVKKRKADRAVGVKTAREARKLEGRGGSKNGRPEKKRRRGRGRGREKGTEDEKDGKQPEGVREVVGAGGGRVAGGDDEMEGMNE